MAKNITIGVLFLALVASLFSGGTKFGASGTEHNFFENFYSGLYSKSVSYGAGVTVATPTTAVTLTAADMCNYGVITLSPTNTILTATLPTAATLVAVSDCLPYIGSTRNLTILSGGFATTTVTFAGASGTTLDSIASTTVNGTASGLLKLTRTGSAAVRAQLIPFDL